MRLDVGKTVLVERAVTTAYLIELVGVASNSVQIGFNKEKYNVGFKPRHHDECWLAKGSCKPHED